MTEELERTVVRATAVLAAALALVFFVFGSSANAQPPARALPFLPIVKAELDAHWPQLVDRTVVPAQIEAESAWNPRAELKTEREHGAGLGQLTRTARFDAFAEARALHPSLRTWSWDDRFDPAKQIRAVVLNDRRLAIRCAPLFATEFDAHGCMLAAYNGGFAGVLRDVELCAAKVNCDPRAWFWNVEADSVKGKQPLPGIGRSAFDINRSYVRRVLLALAPKYQGFV